MPRSNCNASCVGMNEKLPQRDRLQLRIGINYGSCFVQEGDLFGDAVNVAARITKHTGPSQILISTSMCTARSKSDPSSDLLLSRAIWISKAKRKKKKSSRLSGPIRSHYVCEPPEKQYGRCRSRRASLTGPESRRPDSEARRLGQDHPHRRVPHLRVVPSSPTQSRARSGREQV
jgi:hypothetical protein